MFPTPLDQRNILRNHSLIGHRHHLTSAILFIAGGGRVKDALRGKRGLVGYQREFSEFPEYI